MNSEHRLEHLSNHTKIPNSNDKDEMLQHSPLEFEQEINSEMALPIKNLSSSVVDTPQIAKLLFLKSWGRHNLELSFSTRKVKEEREVGRLAY